MQFIKNFINKHPIIFTLVVVMILANVFSSGSNKTSTKDRDLVVLRCEYLDTGLEALPFKYNEKESKGWIGPKGMPIAILKSDASEMTFRVYDEKATDYTDYQFDKTSRLLKIVGSTTPGLEKVKVGRIYCKNEQEVQADKDKEAKAMEEAWGIYLTLKQSIESSLKDPDSAKWDTAYVTKNEVCATVNAKNSFGAYVGKRSYCAKKNSKGDWKYQR